MKNGPRIQHARELEEFLTPERCYIVESWNDLDDAHASIARVRVQAGVTTQWHSLTAVFERYLVAVGSGLVEVEGLPTTRVEPGDVVAIPPGRKQRITNDSGTDLIFYCICTPRFTPSAYVSHE